MQETPETRVRSLDQKDLLEEEMATHSSTLAGESHGQRSLVGYSPWSRKEWDVTEPLNIHIRTLWWRALYNFQSHLPRLIRPSQRQGGVQGARFPFPRHIGVVQCMSLGKGQNGLNIHTLESDGLRFTS